jgi:hypothetical protein
MTITHVPILVSPTGQRLEGTQVNQGGNDVIREVMVAGDPSVAAGLAVVPRIQPGIADYGLAVRPILNTDAFGRFRVSDPITVFDSQHQYRIEPLIWDSTTLNSGTGTITHLPDESAAQLSTGGTGSGAKAVLQSKTYHRYQPGKSHLIMMTAAFGASTTNLRRRIGYFDARNGVFFEQTSSGVSVVKRSYVTGSAVDTSVAQASWNIDPLDGTGPSGITVDWTKSQIFLMDLEWLGVGTVRMGLIVNDIICYAHAFHNANVISTIYMTTANLPIRYEIENTGTTAGTNTMLALCSTVVSEGGFEYERAYKFAYGSGTSIGVTTRRPVMSIRPGLTFNSIAFRGQVIPEHLELTAANNSGYWELVLNGSLTGATFAIGAPTNSATEVDIAANAISGGTVIASGFVLSGSGSTRGMGTEQLSGRIVLGLDAVGTTADILSLVVTSFTGTCNATSALLWRELR